MSWNSHTQPQWGQPPVQPPKPPGARPGWARKRVVIPSAAGLFFVGVIVGSAGSAGSGTTEAAGSAKAAPRATVTVTAQPERAAQSDEKQTGAKEKAKPSAARGSEAVPVPNFVGMGLQSAQDTAQTKGFYRLSSHDSLGRDRMQAFDRNWKVCSQNVTAGRTVSTTTKLDFGAVKVEEDCPARDEKPLEAAGGTMPDLAGKSVKAARGALDAGTSVTVTDAAEGRMVLLESNWKVCTQTPGPGTRLTGQPVEITAVKFEEDCP
ncbi:PASTA domain-containing protein [Streptomyces lavendulocolor]|uniref:PASTA domain-containing protein n=1 Tax=Streptomyces lavendulocolor TaxID=67316 RepID=UPI003C2BC046